MADSGDIHLLIIAAQDAADDAGTAGDYRAKYVHTGRGLVYATSALALSIERFAGAIHPNKERP